ncbi:ATP-binding protein [Paenibacillus thalictri]|uniref:histidine kinase n=1 Tax=Paenibacillus thalictri TaxID=2527873 RepID=A0A4Q9DGZ4_9BACL|nr:ATP-binding protein [Paenibacillus thalictri]TBL70557.1 GHKL domain-containing protein [Paenibacillus thalictri]
MLDVKKQYVRALTDYVVQSGSDDSYPYTSSLKDYLQDMLPEELTALHEECMRILIANVDSTDALSYYHRSFVFLIELMDMCRKSKVSDSGNDLLNELREMLRSTQISFRNVKNKYENVLQHMDSGIALFDNEGFISFVNIKFSQMIGAPRKSLLAQDIRGLLKNRQLKPSTRRLIGRLFQEMIYYRTPFKELIDENGRHLLITVTYGDEFDGDTLISVKDVTEFRRIEQSAYYNDKLAMLGKIAAAIAHEIRNPLTSIRGFIQLLRPDLAQLGKEEYAKIILQEINRANEIINEFLNSSKPTAPVKENIQVAALVKEVSLLYESEALLNGCMIESGGINPDIFISIDVKQIKQVLLNIVKNAMEALKTRSRDQQGFIRITAYLNDGKVSIMISDNGEGVEPGVLSRLFDPFFSTKAEGTGLGLSVSYRIIKNHGGTIQVESKLHEGTTFIVHLPVG